MEHPFLNSLIAAPPGLLLAQQAANKATGRGGERSQLLRSGSLSRRPSLGAIPRSRGRNDAGPIGEPSADFWL